MDEIEEVLDWIERQLAPKLSDWETGFVDSVRRQWDTRGSLSEKQRIKLA